MSSKIFKKYNLVGDDLCYHHTVTYPKGECYYHGPEAHLQYEMLYLLGGAVSYIIEGETYDVKKGDMIFVAPNEIHTLKIDGNEPYERIVLLFNMNILHGIMRELGVNLGAFSYDGKNRFHVIERCDVEKYALDKMLLSIIEETGKEEHKKLKIVSKLISLVVSIDKITSESKNNFTPSRASDRLVRAVTEYVDRNIDRQIRLDELAEELYVSKSTLCHRFSSLMNMTVNRYIITKKIYRATELMGEGYSAQAAAEAVGYSNYTSFFYNYRKIMGVSPTATARGE